MAHNPLDKIHALDAIEKEIIMCLQSAGQALSELGKEKSSQKAAENHTQQFLKSLSAVESKLSEQIQYLTQVSTGQPHEGSGYAAAKVLQMAWHRIHHARSRVRELEESKAKYTQVAVARQQQQMNRFSSVLFVRIPLYFLHLFTILLLVVAANTEEIVFNNESNAL